MVEEVTVTMYKSENGKLFETKQAAEKETAIHNFGMAYSEKEDESWYALIAYGQGVEIAEWILNHKEVTRALLK